MSYRTPNYTGYTGYASNENIGNTGHTGYASNENIGNNGHTGYAINHSFILGRNIGRNGNTENRYEGLLYNEQNSYNNRINNPNISITDIYDDYFLLNRSNKTNLNYKTISDIIFEIFIIYYLVEKIEQQKLKNNLEELKNGLDELNLRLNEKLELFSIKLNESELSFVDIINIVNKLENKNISEYINTKNNEVYKRLNKLNSLNNNSYSIVTFNENFWNIIFKYLYNNVKNISTQNSKIYTDFYVKRSKLNQDLYSEELNNILFETFNNLKKNNSSSFGLNELFGNKSNIKNIRSHEINSYTELLDNKFNMFFDKIRDNSSELEELLFFIRKNYRQLLFLKIHFKGETGVNLTGLTKEFFFKITQQLNRRHEIILYLEKKIENNKLRLGKKNIDKLLSIKLNYEIIAFKNFIDNLDIPLIDFIYILTYSKLNGVPIYTNYKKKFFSKMLCLYLLSHNYSLENNTSLKIITGLNESEIKNLTKLNKNISQFLDTYGFALDYYSPINFYFSHYIKSNVNKEKILNLLRIVPRLDKPSYNFNNSGRLLSTGVLIGDYIDRYFKLLIDTMNEKDIETFAFAISGTTLVQNNYDILILYERNTSEYPFQFHTCFNRLDIMIGNDSDTKEYPLIRSKIIGNGNSNVRYFRQNEIIRKILGNKDIFIEFCQHSINSKLHE